MFFLRTQEPRNYSVFHLEKGKYMAVSCKRAFLIQFWSQTYFGLTNMEVWIATLISVWFFPMEHPVYTSNFQRPSGELLSLLDEAWPFDGLLRLSAFLQIEICFSRVLTKRSIDFTNFTNISTYFKINFKCQYPIWILNSTLENLENHD